MNAPILDKTLKIKILSPSILEIGMQLLSMVYLLRGVQRKFSRSL